MAYLGNDLQVAFPSYRNIDDISGSFNGVTTSFPLTVDGVAPIPAPINSQQCLISVNGVVQRPDDSGTEGFRLSGGNIIFASAPAGGVDFFGVILAGADYVNVGANFPSGTAAAPSITFDSDLDTGIYNPAGNQIGFSTAGTQRLVINSTGQVSSGLGTAAAPAFSFISDPNTGVYSPGADQLALSTNGTGRLFINSSGEIGINTSAPSSQFSVGSDTSAPSVISLDYNPTNTTAASISANHSTGEVRYGAVAAYFPTFYSNNLERLRITSAGLVGIGTSSPTNTSGLEIQTSSTSAPGLWVQTGGTTSSYPILDVRNGANLDVFAVKGDGTSYFQGGKVGIGTTSPSGLLSVHQASASTSNYINITNDATGSSSWLNGMLVGVNSTGDALCWQNENSSLLFGTNNNERARIDSSGRLLVGTTSSPSAGNGQYARIVVQGYTGDATAAGDFSIQRGEAAANITSGEDIGWIRFNDSAGYSFAQIGCYADANAGSSDYPGRLVFFTTADGASSPTASLTIFNAGKIGTGTRTESPYNFTTANAANMHVDGSGFLYRSTSSAKYKTNIETLQNSYADAVLNVRPVWYQSTTGNDNPSWGWWGFIAEEVAEIDPRLVFWRTKETITADDGTTSEVDLDQPVAEGVQYDRFVPHLLNLIKRQQQAIETLEAKVAALESA